MVWMSWRQSLVSVREELVRYAKNTHRKLKTPYIQLLYLKKKGKVGRKMSLTEEMIEINQKTKGQLTNRALILEFNKDRVEKLSYLLFFAI